MHPNDFLKFFTLPLHLLGVTRHVDPTQEGFVPLVLGEKEGGEGRDSCTSHHAQPRDPYAVEAAAPTAAPAVAIPSTQPRLPARRPVKPPTSAAPEPLVLSEADWAVRWLAFAMLRAQTM